MPTEKSAAPPSGPDRSCPRHKAGDLSPMSLLVQGVLLLFACVLTGIPCLLSVMHFRRRTAVKRRALTNLLSDPNILQKYMDRFPSRKGLNDAQSIADDYFATYFNRSEY